MLLASSVSFALAFCPVIGMDDVKSTDSFFTDVEDGSAFLAFLGCCLLSDFK